MNYKIVSDSSSNILERDHEGFASVPMKVVAEKEYVDEKGVDVRAMVEDLKRFKGKSGSSCPNVGEWLEAFGDADWVFGLTISRNLSGSYNSACQAAQAWLEENPGKKIHIFDTLTAGPQQAMMMDKIYACLEAGMTFEETVDAVNDYQNHTHILFCLESLTNLARNGRVNPAVAKIAGMLGIRVCGDAEGGEIIPLHKPRGAKKATQALVEMMKEKGFYDGALLRIAHCYGEDAATDLYEAAKAVWPNLRFRLEPTGALCSFYAEAGGLMIGFEGAYSKVNSNCDCKK